MPERTLSEHWFETKRIAEDRRKRGHSEFPTGIEWLDNITGGYNRGEIWTIAGKSGGGKTCLALQLARSFADNPQHSIMFLSLEMKGWELVLRMFSEMNNKIHTDILAGKQIITEEEDKMFTKYIEGIDFEIFELGYKWEEIEKIIKDHYPSKKPDVIFIDFFQYIDWESFGNERLGLIAYMRRIKEMSKRLNIGFVIVSQLRRLPSGSDFNRPPDMSDTLGSGCIEQTSDKLVLLYRVVEEEKTSWMMKLAKNRQGMTGETEIIFEGQYCRFKDIPLSPIQEKVQKEFKGSVYPTGHYSGFSKKIKGGYEQD